MVTEIGPLWDCNGVYVGALRAGRICYDHRGSRVKILSQGSASTRIKRQRIDKEGEDEEVAVSTQMVVYTNRKEVP